MWELEVHILARNLLWKVGYYVNLCVIYHCPKLTLSFAGAAECLHQETKHLGIRTHLLEIGQFRTNILNSNKKIDKLGPGIVDYEPVKQNLVDRHTATNGSQPGNPELAAERIIDLVRGENMTASKFRNLPLRIPFGSDAVEVIRRKCTETLTIMDEWEEFASSTDFRTKEELPSYYQV